MTYQSLDNRAANPYTTQVRGPHTFHIIHTKSKRNSIDSPTAFVCVYPKLLLEYPKFCLIYPKLIMAWRIHLTNQAIQYVDILKGESDLLAVRVKRNRYAFFDLDSGAQFEHLFLEPPQIPYDRNTPEWDDYLSQLAAPNHVYLSRIETPSGPLLMTEDGGVCLYRADNKNLRLWADGRETTLDRGSAESFSAVVLDRLMGLVVAADNEGRIHIFQQHRRVGSFEFGLDVEPFMPYQLAVSHGGGAIYICDGQRIVALDSAGRQKQTYRLPYDVRQMTCSPDGKLVATSDTDIGMIRVYRASDMTLIRQRFAIDLILHATQVQLMAEIPPRYAAPTSLQINNNGLIALAMAGVVCLTDLDHLDQIPIPA